MAWGLFGQSPTGTRRVQAICDYVHRHITFGYENARSTKTAWEAFNEGKGVCRDYAHLAIAFCRCMNIPARIAWSRPSRASRVRLLNFASRAGETPDGIAPRSKPCSG